MTGLTYDTGALIAAERSDRRMWALHRRALERGAAPVVPAPVLVEGWRGSVQTARLLQGCQVEDLDQPAARAAGCSSVPVPCRWRRPTPWWSRARCAGGRLW